MKQLENENKKLKEQIEKLEDDKKELEDEKDTYINQLYVVRKLAEKIENVACVGWT
jgi:hypothetical protein